MEEKICTCPQTGWYKCPVHSAVPEGTPNPFAYPDNVVDILIDAIRKNKKGIRQIIGDC
jgi:hypothetical protein